MAEVRGVHVTTSTAVKERRLRALLGAGRDASEPRLRAVVEDAQLLGSLELAGVAATWQQVVASRRDEVASEAIRGLRRAQRAVPAGEPLSLEALMAWHAAVAGGAGGAPGLRRSEKVRPGGPPPAPVPFIESRVRSLVEWLGVESARELKPVQAGALALARIVEILPFEDANGRVARLAASHLMVRGSARPPILVAGDRKRLEECLQAAFRLDTEPLCGLLEEASGRALDVMIQALERGM
jgi:Fic family protein